MAMANPRVLPGIKQSQIQKCIGCDQGVMHDNNVVFYIATVRYMVSDIGALQRQTGLEMMMGGPAMAGIAAVMGPDEDMAKELSKHTVWVCLECAIRHPLAMLMEKMPADDEDERTVE